MTRTFYELDCGDEEPAVIEITDTGELVFHNWDLEAEQAAIELGFEASTCFIIQSLWQRKSRALIGAAAMGNLDAVNVFLAAGIDVNFQDSLGQNALMQAAFKGFPKIAQALIAAGADIHVDNDWVLHEATMYGHVDVVKVLLEAGADVNRESARTLRWAAEAGNLEIVELLLAATDEETDPAAVAHARNNAMAYERVEIVELLNNWLEDHDWPLEPGAT
jgi:ankyrin repeat protein